MTSSRRGSLAALLAVVGLCVAGLPAWGQPPGPETNPVEVRHSIYLGESAPLRDLAAQAAASPAVGPAGDEIPRGPDVIEDQPAAAASVVPPAASAGPMPAPSQNWAAQDNIHGYYPPDTNMDVGPNHIVQMVNVTFAVYGKDGTQPLGPLDNNILWGGFGGQCQSTNDGDPIVRYDAFADRWFISQFSLGHPYYECVAVSTGPDPTGSYYRYAFEYPKFPDYPKVGVWPDGYYVTYNMIEDGMVTATACALDRQAMLVGKPADQICKDAPANYRSLVPADIDGPTAPPAGAPNYLMSLIPEVNDALALFRLHVDWATPANSTLSAPISVPVQPFTKACTSVLRGRCIDQPDTPVLLESLGNRLMFRASYRNFGDHESVLVNQTVAMDGDPALTDQTGVAWYEIRSPGSTPTAFQQGTSASPTAGQYRWMASSAMDRQGNIALGYSSSSKTLYPSINYIGRLATDPLGTMPFDEGTIRTGTGSQTGPSARWGDYTSLDVDPSDDCTFWHTNEYLATTSHNDWMTQIASFKFPGCTGSSTVPGAPQNVTATSGDGQVALQWQPPASNGGMPVTKYTVTLVPPVGVQATSAPVCELLVGVDDVPTACDITGLTNGQSYMWRVQAWNALGVGPGGNSPVTTPSTVPDPPTDVLAVPGPSSATVTWTAPVDTGGLPVLDYTVTALPGGATCTTPDESPAPTSCVVPGLQDGNPYTFTVVGRNGRGPSAPSAASEPVVPRPDAAFVSTPPVRVADTRPGQPIPFPARKGPVSAGGTLELPIAGQHGVPAGAAAVGLNVTVVGPAADGFVTVYPCGTQRPVASTLNFRAGQVVANNTLAQPGSAGQVCIYTSAAANLVVDLTGWIPAGVGYTPVPPVRVLETRAGQPGSGPAVRTQVPAGGTVKVPVAGVHSVPADARAVSLNMTAVAGPTAGFLTLFPCGQNLPTASNLNFAPGQVVANSAISGVGQDGAVCVFSSQAADVVVDLNGWFAAGSGFAPQPPLRVADTRAAFPAIAFPAVKQRLAAGSTLAVPVAGVGSVPDNAAAASVNVTAVAPSAPGFLTVFPCGDPVPDTSGVNYLGGQIVANSSLMGVGAGGAVCVFSSQETDLVVDVNGWFPAT